MKTANEDSIAISNTLLNKILMFVIKNKLAT